MLQRGIVISPPFKTISGNLVEIGANPSGLELRKYLLYWDKIDYPDNNIVSISSSPDIQFLELSNVLIRSKFTFTLAIPGLTFSKFIHLKDDGKLQFQKGQNNFKNVSFYDYIFSSQQTAFEQHNLEEPGQWSIAQLSNKPFHNNTVNRLGVEFELYNMLPVPQEDVPLYDILEYKQKRESELLAFRSHLDDVYRLIIEAEDIPRARITEITKLEQALRDIDKTLQIDLITRTVSSLRTYIGGEFPSALGAGLGGAGISPMIGMSPILAGLACAGLALSVKPLISPKTYSTSNPFTYLQGINRL